MAKQIVNTNEAPASTGYFSQAVKMGPLVFVSGQLPIKPEDGRMEEGGTKRQASRALHNMYQVLKAGGATLEQVVKITLYITDKDTEKFVDEEMKRYFPKEPPARTTIMVSALPRGAKLSVDAVAVLA